MLLFFSLSTNAVSWFNRLIDYGNALWRFNINYSLQTLTLRIITVYMYKSENVHLISIKKELTEV